VENAVKHGQEVDGRLRIAISADVRNRVLELTVSSSGFLSATRAPNGRPPAEDPAGFALRNVRARLESAYAERAALLLTEEGGFVRATIRIRDDVDAE
jgi:LytS/YehU family sensor histidine kinase